MCCFLLNFVIFDVVILDIWGFFGQFIYLNLQQLFREVQVTVLGKTFFDLFMNPCIKYIFSSSSDSFEVVTDGNSG